jgi:hypothetical protein
MKTITKLTMTSFALSTLVATSASWAGNTWANYHWARTSNSFSLLVVDSTTPDWDTELTDSIFAWSQSNVLNMSITSSNDSSGTRRSCASVGGQIRVCNHHYGNNGWLGLASINIDSNDHILYGIAKVNDSYSMDSVERNHVMCQEIGHLFGLDHVSVDGSSQQTCMDYSDDPNSQWPNNHDYDTLESMYAHTDSYNTYDNGATFTEVSSTKSGKKSNVLGRKIFAKGRMEMWVNMENNGTLTVTHVYRTDDQQHQN